MEAIFILANQPQRRLISAVLQQKNTINLFETILHL